MDKAKRARTAETPKQPSLGLMLRAPCLYPDRVYSAKAGMSNTLPLVAAAAGVPQTADPLRLPAATAVTGHKLSCGLYKSRAILKRPVAPRCAAHSNYARHPRSSCKRQGVSIPQS
jgi:hypothetical protein